MTNYPMILPEPRLPKHVPDKVRWLAGEGAGSWFLIENNLEKHYKITRYSPEGKIECEGIFYSIFRNVDLERDFKISYPSHCATVTLVQDKRTITLKRLKTD